MRFDVYLFENKYFDSRNKAAAAIKDRQFSINGKMIDKPSYEISASDQVEVIKNKTIYVARSAQKLLTAIRVFGLSFQGKTVADLGASTGGFCQVLLQNDAKNVYAVDIGTAQLHPTIKDDPRIINMEHINARYLDKNNFPCVIDAVTADLSFISLKLILPAIQNFLKDQGLAVLLIKPQFETGPQHLSKNGVVLDRKIHKEVIREVADFSEQCSFGIAGIAFSGLAGESGNREYLLYLVKNGPTKIDVEQAIQTAVYTEESYE